MKVDGKKLVRGMILRHKVTGKSYVLDEDYEDMATLVRSIRMDNPDEWEIIDPLVSAPPAAMRGEEEAVHLFDAELSARGKTLLPGVVEDAFRATYLRLMSQRPTLDVEAAVLEIVKERERTNEIWTICIRNVLSRHFAPARKVDAERLAESLLAEIGYALRDGKDAKATVLRVLRERGIE